MPTQHRQDRRLVQRHFRRELATYATEKAAAHRSPVIPFLEQWAAAPGRDDRPLSVCEFGGGGGVLLAELLRRIDRAVTACNAELVSAYRVRQTDRRIRFLLTSVLDPCFPSETFDVVVLRNVLHHLIGPSFGATRANQRRAVQELFRVTKPGGLVLIEEQVVEDRLACRAVYALSRCAARLGITLRAFQITPSTVVAFLTGRQLTALCDGHAGPDGCASRQYKRWPRPWRWRITWFMRNTGELFLAWRKPSEHETRTASTPQ